MIVTDNKKLEQLVKKNSIVVIDDINSSNISDVQAIVVKSTIYVRNKLSLPTNNSEIIGKRSKTVSEINSYITQLNDDLLQGKSKWFTNDTQVRNFKVKLLHWCDKDFSNVVEKLDNNEECIIVIQYSMSKHEKLFLEILVRCGAAVLIINEDGYSKEDSNLHVESIKYNTHEKLSIKAVNNAELKSYTSLNDVEEALYDKHETVKIVIKGIALYNDTCDFYGKLYRYCENNNNTMLLVNGFDKPTYEQTSKIPRLANKNPEYIVSTLLKFLEVTNECKEVLYNIMRKHYLSTKYNDVTAQVLYNKIVNVICTLNKLFKYNINLIVYYGEIKKNDYSVIDIIKNMPNMSIIIACSDKSKIAEVEGMSLLELESSVEVFPIPMIDKRESAQTMAAQVQSMVNTTLFSGDALGMYKPGQFTSAKSILFDTTYDEIKLWWNKEMYLRPGFVASGTVCTIPVMFRVIKGVKDKYTYFNEIQQYCCGKTLICNGREQLSSKFDYGMCCKIHRGTDINGTKFEEQKPFFCNGKLDKNRIMNGTNYPYRFLDINKQRFILDKIEEILIGNEVDTSKYGTKQEFIDDVLNIGLNIGQEILAMVQWFEFYTYNPNVVLIINSRNMPDIHNFIELLLLYKLGFDVLVIVPTCYSTIEPFVGSRFAFNTNIIGEADFETDLANIKLLNNIEIPEAVNDTEKKKGFWAKLLGN